MAGPCKGKLIDTRNFKHEDQITLQIRSFSNRCESLIYSDIDSTQKARRLCVSISPNKGKSARAWGRNDGITPFMPLPSYSAPASSCGCSHVPPAFVGSPKQGASPQRATMRRRPACRPTPCAQPSTADQGEERSLRARARRPAILPSQGSISRGPSSALLWHC